VNKVVFIWLISGVLCGASEFLLTGFIVKRMLQGEMPALLLIGKLASYAAILLPVFFLLPRGSAMWFGIGAGGGVLVFGIILAVYTLVKEKR
jgi:hypothetical protein